MKTIIILILFVLVFLMYRTITSQNSSEATEFESGSFPEPALSGFYKGTPPSGYFGSWRGKKFFPDSSSGSNIFYVAARGEEEKYSFHTSKSKGLLGREGDVLVLSYDISENPFWIKVFRDEIVQTASGKYLGRIYFTAIPSFPLVLGHFWLEKEEK